MVGRTVADGIVWIDRTEFGFPATVFSTDGHTHRPKLRMPTTWLTLHYTGSPRSVVTATVADVVDAMQRIERNAIASGKSNEYNYAIFATDTEAVIAEYAGTFRAAHSEGENGESVGVLFYLGCTKVDDRGFGLEFQTMPDKMVTAYRFLRDEVLRKFSITNLNTLEVFHKDMPDAATQCPGASIIGRHAELLASGGFDALSTGTTNATIPAANVDAARFGGLPKVQPGDRGDAVKRVQALLLAAGFDPGTLDGKYFKTPTSPTRSAVVGFQTTNRLPTTGTVTLQEWARLLGVE